MDQEIVKELIQGEFNEQSLKAELETIVVGGSKREKMLSDFNELAITLGGPGASKRTAELIVAALKK